MSQWVKKYQPKNLDESCISSIVCQRLRNIALSGGSALIYGPVGCGKTSAIYALANEINYEILEINASDLRNREQIDSVVKAASAQRSLFSQGKIILVDEIDGLAGMADRGGVQALADILKESNQAIIMTANDPWQSKLSTIRNKSKLVEFEQLENNKIFEILKVICLKEKIVYDESLLKTMSINCGGDLRAAINDLQTVCETTKTLNDLSVLGEREQKREIFDALRLVFKSNKVENTLDIFREVDMNEDEVILWIEENLPKEYAGKDLAKAYDVLSKVDILRGRIRRGQYWRFLIYINNLISSGIAMAKTEKRAGFTSYQRTTRILKLWKAKMKYEKRKSIAEKVASKTHTSIKRAIRDTIPYMKLAIETNPRLISELELNDDEVDWIKQ